jgi:cytochrome oxidase Cu insertion factor (SCO1/SenC/PrrC family)
VEHGAACRVGCCNTDSGAGTYEHSVQRALTLGRSLVRLQFILAAVLTLIDQHSRPVALSAFAGHPLAVSFVSAHCTDVCPLIDAQIAQAAALERARRGRMRFLTITLDPERDTHADMVRLSRVFDADATYWRIASGPPQLVHVLMDRFGIKVGRGSDGFADAHTSAVIVLDGRGNVAAALLPSSNLAAQLETLEIP